MNEYDEMLYDVASNIVDRELADDETLRNLESQRREVRERRSALSSYLSSPRMAYDAYKLVAMGLMSQEDLEHLPPRASRAVADWGRRLLELVQEQRDYEASEYNEQRR